MHFAPNRLLPTAFSSAASRLAILALVAALTSISTPAEAKLYKIVGPDGKVTYTDKPPTNATKGKVKKLATKKSKHIAKLPKALQKPASNYPVVLYAAPDCGPCGTGRIMLQRRGIPYEEKSVTTDKDFKALKRFTKTDQLPVLQIGNKQLRGYKEDTWNKYLTAAEYPTTSQLPDDYPIPEAQPLTKPAKPKVVAEKRENKKRELTPEEQFERDVEERKQKALKRVEEGEIQF